VRGRAWCGAGAVHGLTYADALSLSFYLWMCGGAVGRLLGVRRAGVIDLTQCTGLDKKPPPTIKGGNWGFDIVTRARTFAIEVETETSRQQWIAVIGTLIDAKNRPDQAALIASVRGLGRWP
jgi:hypothetical protein